MFTSPFHSPFSISNYSILDMSKEEFFEKYSWLLKNEKVVEKEIIIYLVKKDKHNSQFKCSLEEDDSLYSKEQQQERLKFQTDLQRTDHTINVFKGELHKPKPVIEQIKYLMENIESQIVNIKTYEKSIYDTLLQSESALTAELNVFDNDLERFERTITHNLRPVSVKSRTQTSNKHNLHPAVMEFDKFCSLHGPSGGWGEFEQQLFLKTYKSVLQDNDILEKLRPSLPFKSDPQILDHISWYRQYLKLEKAKKDSLKEWRDTKKNKPKVKADLSKKSNVNEITLKKKELYEKERKERLAHLNAYKIQKELQRVLAEEDALKAKIAEEEKEMKRQQYVQQQKEKALEFKEKKRLENELRDAEEQDLQMASRSQTQVSSTDLLRLHEKNMKIVEKKQQQKQEKIIADFESQQKLEKMKHKVEVKRDPSRLLQKTKGQLNRERDTSKSVNPVVGSRTMPHRAMPAWRKGL